MTVRTATVVVGSDAGRLSGGVRFAGPPSTGAGQPVLKAPPDSTTNNSVPEYGEVL